MTQARAGVVAPARGAAYLAVGLLVVAITCGVVVAAFDGDRLFTGLLIGAALGVAAALALFARDAIWLTADGIVVSTPWSRQTTPWSTVLAARFAKDTDGRWSLTLDLSEPAGGELTLLAVPPVQREVANPYELRKRQQVKRILATLHEHGVPTTVLPEIGAALDQHWRVKL
ncbi:hypothetical protein OG921_20880 [Aldersonia sp. NBC_00410]|uniref:hypothetical protein n=1 Tax=Aldersonia sp. NBC_00410 TaxID=2975954 RepID=UPI002259E63D|nr:hypothetical protein [Aldersonia sp. NBC_00410]MCX5045624.1 hypothetical protein [Aldersonia sp. NBC_00410]